MALFTDAGVITITDLLDYEGTLVQVASDHDINVVTKIQLAMNAIGDRLMLWLLNIGASDPQFLTRRLIGLSTLVVDDPLRRWVVFESLSRIFAEAYNLQLNTRFHGKWTEYRQAADSAADFAFQSGLGIVFDPLPEPALPLVSVDTGTSNAAALYVQTTWVDDTGGESAASPINGLILAAASGITVAMAEGNNAPVAAIGWNVYIAVDQSGAARQTTVPQPIGSTWQLPTAGLIGGSAPGSGQVANVFIRTSKQILRG